MQDFNLGQTFYLYNQYVKEAKKKGEKPLSLLQLIFKK